MRWPRKKVVILYGPEDKAFEMGYLNTIWPTIAASKSLFVAGCLILCNSAFPSAASLRCNGVTLSLTDQSARANLRIIDGRVSDAEFDRALRLPGNLALVEKSNQTGALNTIDDLRFALSTAREGQTPNPDLFGIGRLRRDMNAAKDLLELLDRDAENIIGRVCEKLTPYLPEGYEQDIKVFILAGGYATGFTFDDGADFFLAAQRIGDDPAGLELVIVHELFHVIQTSLSPLSKRRMQEAEKAYPVKSRALAHLFNGYLEGGATWVANADDYSGQGRTVSYFKDVQGNYSQRFRRLFVTFEAYLYQLFNDPAADSDKIYSAGFMDDGPLYFVGFYMARELEKENGASAIRDLLSQPPTTFYQEYQSLCHANKELLCFSPTTESIINDVADILR